MNSILRKTLLASIAALIAAPAAFAHDGDCVHRLTGRARAEKWQAQREQIEFLEKNGGDFKNLSRAYRSLIQDLFDADAGERVRVILLVFPSGSILRRVDISLPTPQFTEDLIRAMSQVMEPAQVLKKLHELADHEADKIFG